MSLLFLWIFVALMVVGTPVVFALVLAPGMALWVDGQGSMIKALVGRM